jgi:hypothetical protein
MSSLNYRTPEAIPAQWSSGAARRKPGGWEHPSASGEAEFRSPWLSSGLRSRPTGPPYMSIKCSDSHDMKEYGFRFCFLDNRQQVEILPGLYCLRRQPARWQALGTSSRHYASKE